MPSYWSISRVNCLFCSYEGPSELAWITFALLFSLSVLSCLSSPIFLSITEQYGWLGADGLLPISVGVALPLTPLTVWYSATGRSDRKVTTLTEKLATRTRVCPALGTSRERGIPMLEVPCTSFYPSRIVGLLEFCSQPPSNLNLIFCLGTIILSLAWVVWAADFK